jgi:uracil-DNA glycosylase
LGCTIPSQVSDLTGWAEQGVLLLNSVLTVRDGQAFSHRDKGWETFTDHIIDRLNARAEPILFILWGAAAQKKKERITGAQHAFILSAHPSPLSAYRGFFGSKPFSKANAILTEKFGGASIDWTRITRA